jgi:aspartyl-tRNA(Asn)/glutamyl-tRNA(Gln) amidotransferase subunit A
MSPWELGVADAGRAVRSKALSPVDLLEALLARIDAVDARVQAWALVDRAGARATARQLADEAARGILRGPLHGVPFGVKDIFYTAGLRTEAGSKVLAGFVPAYGDRGGAAEGGGRRARGQGPHDGVRDV